MARPFTTFHICRFLFLCLLAIGAVYFGFRLLSQVRGSAGLTPSKVSRLMPGAVPAFQSGCDTPTLQCQSALTD